MNNGAKTAVILIGHGSRVAGSSKDMEKVASRLEDSGVYRTVAVCYMSRNGPFFPQTLERVVRDGAGKVVVIPYFLHSGLHLVHDIPSMLQREAAKYPQVTVVCGKHLGYDNAMVALVQRRIEESEDLADVRTLALQPKESFPLAEDELEFVPMTPEEAREYKDKQRGRLHYHN